MELTLNTTVTTPIMPLKFKNNNNNFYIKREDLLPFSFGGNKVRIATKYFQDLLEKNYDCIITYGSSKSNMNRVIANMSRSLEIPCYVVTPLDNNEKYSITNNSKLINLFEAEIVTCKKSNVAGTIDKLINKLKLKGFTPYYIHGDKFGKGNEKIAVSAYANVYDEILKQEKENNIKYDYIIHASGTGTTQSGLISGKLKNKDKKEIIGISISRNEKIGKAVISNDILAYFEKNHINNLNQEITFIDDYLSGGYGKSNNEIEQIIEKILITNGIYLDRTYTGKAFWGMNNHIKKSEIKNSNILFIHTGSTPLFFDDLNKERGS